MKKPTEQQVRDVLTMLCNSSIVELRQVIYFDRDYDEDKVANLGRISSTEDFISNLKSNGDIRED